MKPALFFIVALWFVTMFVPTHLFERLFPMPTIWKPVCEDGITVDCIVADNRPIGAKK